MSEDRDEGRQRPARQPLGERARQKIGRLDVRDHVAEAPGKKQHERGFEDVLHALDPGLDGLVQGKHTLFDGGNGPRVTIRA